MKTIETKIRVRYGETDQMGFAFYANYLSWFEVGRSEFCRALSHPYKHWEEKGVMLPAVEAYVRYKHPLRYDDVAVIKTSVQEVKPYSVTFSYEVLLEENGRLVAEGWTRHAFCDPTGKLVKEPEPFYSWIKEQLEKND